MPKLTDSSKTKKKAGLGLQGDLEMWPVSYKCIPPTGRKGRQDMWLPACRFSECFSFSCKVLLKASPLGLLMLKQKGLEGQGVEV